MAFARLCPQRSALPVIAEVPEGPEAPPESAADNMARLEGSAPEPGRKPIDLTSKDPHSDVHTLHRERSPSQMLPEPNTSIPAGVFTFANGKPPSISSAGLEAAKKLLSDLDLTHSDDSFQAQDAHGAQPMLPGHHTARFAATAEPHGGSAISMSKPPDALEQNRYGKATHRNAQASEQQEVAVNTGGFNSWDRRSAGTAQPLAKDTSLAPDLFMSASGKAVVTSNEARLRAQQLFADLDTIQEADPHQDQVRTVSSKEEAVQASKLASGLRLQSSSSLQNHDSVGHSSFHQAVASASGERSELANQTAQQPNSLARTDAAGTKRQNGETLHRDTAEEAHHSAAVGCIPVKPPTLPGPQETVFQFASGRSMQVSSAAVKRAKVLMEEWPSDDLEVCRLPPC